MFLLIEKMPEKPTSGGGQWLCDWGKENGTDVGRKNMHHPHKVQICLASRLGGFKKGLYKCMANRSINSY